MRRSPYGIDSAEVWESRQVWLEELVMVVQGQMKVGEAVVLLGTLATVKVVVGVHSLGLRVKND